MSVRQSFLKAIGLTLLAMGFGLPVQAQTTEMETPIFMQAENLGAGSLLSKDSLLPTADNHKTEHLVAEEIGEIAQSRRRRRNDADRRAMRSPDFVGIGVNFGYVNDVSGSIISKISVSDKVSIRPEVSLGEDLAILVPITYEFRQFSTAVSGFQLLPYAGLGASWANENNNNGSTVSDVHLLLSAGVDVPVSERFTVNAQANLGLFNDTEFGATVGVGYNIGNLFR